MTYFAADTTYSAELTYSKLASLNVQVYKACFYSFYLSMWKCSEAVYVQKVANSLESRILFFSSLRARAIHKN